MPKSTYSEPIAFTHRKPVIYAIGVSSAITAEVSKFIYVFAFFLMDNHPTKFPNFNKIYL